MNEFPIAKLIVPEGWKYQPSLSGLAKDIDEEGFKKTLRLKNIDDIHILKFTTSREIDFIIVASPNSEIEIKEDCIGDDYYVNVGDSVLDSLLMEETEGLPAMICLDAYVSINKLYNLFDIRHASVIADSVGEIRVIDSYVEAEEIFLSRIVGSQMQGGNARLYQCSFEKCGFLNKDTSLRAFDVSLNNLIFEKDDKDLFFKVLTERAQ